VAFALAAAAAVMNAVVAFIEPAEVDRSKEHIPRAARQGFQSDRQRVAEGLQLMRHSLGSDDSARRSSMDHQRTSPGNAVVSARLGPRAARPRNQEHMVDTPLG